MPVNPNVCCCPRLASHSTPSAQKCPSLDDKSHGHPEDRQRECEGLLVKEQAILPASAGACRVYKEGSDCS